MSVREYIQDCVADGYYRLEELPLEREIQVYVLADTDHSIDAYLGDDDSMFKTLLTELALADENADYAHMARRLQFVLRDNLRRYFDGVQYPPSEIFSEEVAEYERGRMPAWKRDMDTICRSFYRLNGVGQ